VTALIVVQAAVFAVVFWHKSLVQDRALRSLVVDLASRSRELASRSREQAILPGFYASPEPWNQVVELVRQTLDLGWLIFLERIPDQYYVREIAALNCRFADIDERRRDYRRVPYSDAVAERQTVRLEQRLFLKADSAIDQYMTPLLFGGELLGFWAMGVSPDKVAANPDFFVLVDDIRDQIAEMLYHRLQWQQQQTSQTSGERFRYLRLDGGENSMAARICITRCSRRCECSKDGCSDWSGFSKRWKPPPFFTIPSGGFCKPMKRWPRSCGKANCRLTR